VSCSVVCVFSLTKVSVVPRRLHGDQSSSHPPFAVRSIRLLLKCLTKTHNSIQINSLFDFENARAALSRANFDHFGSNCM